MPIRDSIVTKLPTLAVAKQNDAKIHEPVVRLTDTVVTVESRPTVAAKMTKMGTIVGIKLDDGKVAITDPVKVNHTGTDVEFNRPPIHIPGENLCKWCLSYVGTRRKFCSADCAAQFRLCQRQREQKQNLNISVDYYGNVKLSIQGQPISEGKDGTTSSRPFATEAGGTRRSRRRRRCRFCAKLLVGESDSEFCDDTCQNMAEERTKREDFVNVFQQKEVAERRRIRKWLLDAQDQYTRQTEGQEFVPERHDLDGLVDITSGPAALNPLPCNRTPLPNIPQKRRSKETPGRTGVPAYSFRRHLVHYVPERLRINRDEMSSSGVTGGPVTLNPIPIRKHGLRPEDKHTHMDPDKRELRVDLKWIPKFYG